MKTVSIEEAKSHFDELIASVVNGGEQVAILNGDETVAQLVPPPTEGMPRRRKSFLDRTKNPKLALKINYDPIEQVSDEDWMTPLK